MVNPFFFSFQFSFQKSEKLLDKGLGKNKVVGEGVEDERG